MGASASIDQINMRRSNLALVLGELIRAPRTRAQLAADIRMTKGAIGSLVADLIERGLVQLEEASSAGAVGRPGQVVVPVPSRAYSIGISFSPPYVIGVAIDLKGGVLAHTRVILAERITPPEELLRLAVGVIRELASQMDDAAGSLLAGVAVAVPDLVDSHAGIVRRSPTVGLTDYPLAHVLRTALADLDIPVTIDNDATLGALAEARRPGLERGENLLYLTGSTAMGGGIMVDGVPFRGAAGFAGEVGHMVINPDGKPCVCGSRGCWESEVGLDAFLAMADPDGDPSIDGDDRIAAIVKRAEAGDAQVMAAIHRVARFLGLGLSSLINIFNPDTVILGGYFIRIFPFLIQPVQLIVHERVLSERLLQCRITHSELEMYAGAMGAGISVVDRVVADPAAIPRLTQSRLHSSLARRDVV